MYIGKIPWFHGGFLGGGMRCSLVRKCCIGKQFIPSVPSLPLPPCSSFTFSFINSISAHCAELMCFLLSRTSPLCPRPDFTLSQIILLLLLLARLDNTDCHSKPALQGCAAPPGERWGLRRTHSSSSWCWAGGRPAPRPRPPRPAPPAPLLHVWQAGAGEVLGQHSLHQRHRGRAGGRAPLLQGREEGQQQF